MTAGGVFDFLLQKASSPPDPTDYTMDGLRYCGHCNTPKQCRIVIEGKKRIVPCQCSCREREREAAKKAAATRDEKARINGLRVNGIADHSTAECRFDTAEDCEVIRKCRRYVENWAAMKKDNTGLLLWGGVGSGKTFAAACIANALIDRRIPALVTSFPRILSAPIDQRGEIVRSLTQYPLLVLDDLGAERATDYALETVYLVVDERYKAGKPLIVTTNLTPDYMKQQQDVTFSRIYSRVLEMTVPIRCAGKSRREDNAAAKLERAAKILNG